jgi:hypothetical protein
MRRRSTVVRALAERQYRCCHRGNLKSDRVRRRPQARQRRLARRTRARFGALPELWNPQCCRPLLDDKEAARVVACVSRLHEAKSLAAESLPE